MTQQIASTEFELNGSNIKVVITDFRGKNLIAELMGQDKELVGYQATVTVDGSVTSQQVFTDEMPMEALEKSISETVKYLVVKPALAAAIR